MGACFSGRSFQGDGQRLGSAAEVTAAKTRSYSATKTSTPAASAAAAGTSAGAGPSAAPGPNGLGGDRVLGSNARTASRKPDDPRSAALAAAEARVKSAKDRGTNEANARKGELSSKLAKAPTSASVKDKDSRLPDRIVYD